MLDLQRLLNVREGQKNDAKYQWGTSAQGWTGHVRPMYSAGSSSDNHCNHYARMLHPRIAISMPVKPVPNAILTVPFSLGVELFAT